MTNYLTRYCTKHSIFILTLMGLMGATGLPATASDAFGTPFSNNGFEKDDWQVVCDNTLTCRAAGYQDETTETKPASIMLVAKPKVALPEGYVKLIDDNRNKPQTIQLWLNGKNYGNLSPKLQLTSQQTQQLLNSADNNLSIVLKSPKMTWQISDKGMNAVLLKLDEVQGRVGTKLALVSKNNPNLQTPKDQRPQPIIHKAYAYPDDTRHSLTPAKKAYFNNNINKWININAKQFIGSKDSMGECELINPASEQSQNYKSETFEWTFSPIDANNTLASHPCWRAAYNEGYGYWLINNAKPNQPQLITTSGISYANGQISSASKGRGIGDCWSGTVWTWNGKTFVKSSELTTGMCRGFEGGAWELPTYVTKVVKN
ncbi:DUF1176 domain-containing protein [Psychrobacter sp.]|uniref:DUF1176 domain-containing protein n=1 Tax=Psychrobacter sp. TaxID=56811 RepID=UPI0025E79E80|nr:DUF1176 domain-containing protein [Psychrobacter sp.]